MFSKLFLLFQQQAYIWVVDSMKKIVIVFLAVVYLFLSTGVTLYQTLCDCVGGVSVSLFVESETCDEILPDHHCAADENACAQCDVGHVHGSCGCDSPRVNYLKLTDHFGVNSNLVPPLSEPYFLIGSCEPGILNLQPFQAKSPVFLDYSPPENPFFGRNLINFINQRKIALTA